LGLSPVGAQYRINSIYQKADNQSRVSGVEKIFNRYLSKEKPIVGAKNMEKDFDSMKTEEQPGYNQEMR